MRCTIGDGAIGPFVAASIRARVRKRAGLFKLQPAEKQHRQRTIDTSYLLEIAAARGLPSKLRARPEACGTISDCRKCLTSSKKEL
jgi:hypothetical protein